MDHEPGLESREQLTPEQQRQNNLLELQRLRETGEIAQNNFDIEILFRLVDSGQPIRRKDVGDQAIVLSQVEFSQLGAFEITLQSGEEICIDPDDFSENPNDKLVIFPQDLGE